MIVVMNELQDGEMGIILDNPVNHPHGGKLVQALTIKGNLVYQIIGQKSGQRWSGGCSLEVRKLSKEDIENLMYFAANPYANLKTTTIQEG